MKLKCVTACQNTNSQCLNKVCQYWLNYPKELNCTFVSIETNGPMNLREISERMELTFPRIQQIEKKAIAKIREISNEEDYL